MSNPDAPEELRLRPRPDTSFTLSIPVDLLERIRGLAAARDMSPDALLKLYIGQGMRQDASRQFSEDVLETTVGTVADRGAVPDDEMLDEYDLKGGVRGKYAERSARGTNWVFIDSDPDGTEMSIQEIERTVRALSPEDLSRFREWFLEFDATTWDRELAEDAGSGRLDALADEAAGRTRPL